MIGETGPKGLLPMRSPDPSGFLAEQGVTGRDLTVMLALLAGLLQSGAANAESFGPDASKPDADRLQPGLYPASPGLPAPQEEPLHLPFHLDWSIGLKGSYTSSSTDGGSFLTTLNPAFAARHDGQRMDLVVDGDAELARPWDGSGTIAPTALRLGLSATMPLDSTTQLNGSAALNFSQSLAGTPGLNPAVDVPPQMVSGSVGLGLDRSFGKFNLGLKGSLARSVYGATLRTDTGLTDNSDQNLWAGDASLRAGLQVTPIIEVFAEGSLGRDVFDMTSSTLGVSTNATSTALRGGVAGSWNGVWRASASLGVGQYDFDDISLGDVTTRLYDASLTYSPDPTVNLTASLSTSIEPTGADANGTARVAHVAAANVDYAVNSWLRLRASADWGLSLLEGSGETQRRHGVGAGADYALNRQTALSADYAYAHRDNSIGGPLDTHTLSVGITLRR